MKSRWLFLVAVGLMAFVCARAGSLKQLEDDIFDKTLRSEPLQNDEAMLEMLKTHLLKAKEEVAADQLQIDSNYEKAEEEGRSLQSRHYGGRMSPALKKGSMQGQIMERGIRRLAQDMGYSKEQVSALYGQVLSDAIQQSIGCHDKKVPKCNSRAPFRTVDGTCNNLKKPLLGSTNTPFRRLLPPDYGDNIGSPRRAKNGGKLQNARRVSFSVFDNVPRPSTKVTHISMNFGQLLDHDMTLSPHVEVECNGSCSVPGTDCFGITVPPEDPHFPAQGVSCMQLTRSAPAAPLKCKLQQRQQANTLTSFLDASMVYGADPVTAARERDLDSDLGLMRETNNPNGYNFLPLLPQVDDPTCDPDDGTNDQCFTSGDVRVNENPGLASLQTLWVREHNRIARRLKDLKPCLKGEQIYQIARKIVGAEIQHITITEYLPHILDRDTLERNNLVPKSSGFFKGYNENVDPTIANSFAGAAYRFGHSMVRNHFSRYGPSPGNPKFDDIETKNFFNPSPLYSVCKGGLDSIYRGLYTDQAESVDASFSEAVQQDLRLGKGQPPLDLVTLNIQRGRDYGLPGYNSFRKLCGLPTLKTFDDLRGVLPQKVVSPLKKLYSHIDDVDLFVGGISEIKEDDHVIGPTFSCLIAKQFAALRAGDRFWYESGDPVAGFPLDQLTELRKVTLAGVICDNSDSIRVIPQKVLEVSSRAISCADLKQMDLRKFINVAYEENEGGAEVSGAEGGVEGEDFEV